MQPTEKVQLVSCHSDYSLNGNNLSLTVIASNGTWIFSGTDNYTGGTILTAGTLVLTHTFFDVPINGPFFDTVVDVATMLGWGCRLAGSRLLVGLHLVGGPR